VTQVYELFQTWNGGGRQDGLCYNEAVNFEAVRPFFFMYMYIQVLERFRGFRRGILFRLQ